MFEMTHGKIAAAQKVVIYGPEGVGKSTLAARFPKPLFIDTEGGTNKMNVARYPKPTSWEMLKNEVREAPKTGCKTVIIDTIDWAEKLCITTICDASQKKGIEDFGYGKGYVYEREEFGRFLDLLQSIVDSGVNVVLTAHAQIRKFEQPDELGAYDRWELKLGQKTGSQISPLVKEWADMVLFCNYKTHTVVTDKDGKKRKAQGGERVMYTSHNPCWDAKNRDGLPEILPLAYEPIAHIFGDMPASNAPDVGRLHEQVRAIAPAVIPPPAPVQTATPPMPETLPPVQSEPTAPEIPDGIPRELADLMIQDNIFDYEIQFVVSQEGFCPPDMPISAYPPEFIKGWIVPNWGMVREKAKAAALDGVPF